MTLLARLERRKLDLALRCQDEEPSPAVEGLEQLLQ
jgi:hypothetical protein